MKIIAKQCIQLGFLSTWILLMCFTFMMSLGLWGSIISLNNKNQLDKDLALGYGMLFVVLTLIFLIVYKITKGFAEVRSWRY